MRHIPYGYKIENGVAVVDEKEAEETLKDLKELQKCVS